MLILLLLSATLIQVTLGGWYEERLKFHGRLCKEKPELKSCLQPYTTKQYTLELLQEQEYKQMRAGTTGQPSWKNDRKRSSPWYSPDDDDEYEYRLWRKYRREKLRRKLAEAREESSPELHEHYHYHQNSPQYSTGYYRPSYSYPSYSYPSYYSSYPSYGGGYGGYGGYPSYGGYGRGYGGGGGLFNIGFGRQLGIMTPIGGFGYSSGFGIGIGKK